MDDAVDHRDWRKLIKDVAYYYTTDKGRE